MDNGINLTGEFGTRAPMHGSLEAGMVGGLFAASASGHITGGQELGLESNASLDVM